MNPVRGFFSRNPWATMLIAIVTLNHLYQTAREIRTTQLKNDFAKLQAQAMRDATLATIASMGGKVTSEDPPAS